VVTWTLTLFDFQQVGEYVLVTDGAGLLVQVRQGPYRGSRSIATNIGVAMNLGGTRVTLYPGTPATLNVNGNPTTVDGVLAFDGGAVDTADGSYTFTWPNGDAVRATVYYDHLDLIVDLPTITGRQLNGLLGTAAASFVPRNGDAGLPTPINIQQLFHTFGDTWRISQAESLFDYPTGEGTANFTDLNFPYSISTTGLLPAATYTSAAQTCADAGVTNPYLLNACILDWAVTQDVSFTRWEADVPPPAGALYAAYYWNNFQGTVGPEWSTTQTTAAPGSASYGPTSFLGPLGTTQLTLDNLPPHDTITVSFDTYILGGWTGNGAGDAGVAPATWELDVDGTPMFVTSFSNEGESQAYPGTYVATDAGADAGVSATNPPGTGAEFTNVLGLEGEMDAIYHQSFTFPDTASSLTLSFSSNGLSNGAGWGLTNLELDLLSTPDASAPTVDAGTLDASADASAPDGGACTSLPSGASVTAVAGDGTAPTPSGGTIASGTYGLAAATIYGCGSAGFPAESVAASLSFAATSATQGDFEASFAEVSGDAASTLNATGIYYEPESGMLYLEPTCGASSLLPFEYAVAGSQLLLIIPNTACDSGVGTEVLTLNQADAGFTGDSGGAPP
jgi:hypothetical protein